MEPILEGLRLVVEPLLLLALFGGVVAGFIVGVLPGLSTSNTAAILLPFTLTVPVEVGLVLIVSIYAGAAYGGAIPAILLNIPGEAGSAATALDGYPMTRQGRAAEALGIARMASVIGGAIGAGAAILMIGPLADYALRFGPAEMFLVAVLGLTMVGAVVGDNPSKGLFAALLGMLIAAMAADPFTGQARFTMGFLQLYEEVPFVPALIGLFAFTEMLLLARHAGQNEQLGGVSTAGVSLGLRAVADGVRTTLRQPVNVLRSSFIGLGLGIIPGIGTAISNFVAYGQARSRSKHPELFGKGSPEGVVASEACDNAVTGGAMVPMLALGIPGSATTAVLLAALYLQGIQPGPQVLRNFPAESYALLIALFVANLLILPLGVLLAGPMILITRVKIEILVPIVLVVCVVGTYAFRNSLFDVGLAFVFGLLGILMRSRGFPVVPLVLGLILGPIAEENFIRSLQLGRYRASFFVSSTISKILVLFLLLIVVGAARRAWRRRHHEDAEPAPETADQAESGAGR